MIGSQRRLTWFIFCSFGCLVVVSHSFAAQNQKSQSAFYSASGLKFYEQGDFQKALTEFVDAFMADASNETARQYLFHVIPDHPAYQKEKMKLHYLKDLLEYIAFLNQRFAELENKNFTLERFILKEYGDNNSIVKTIELINIETNTQNSNMEDIAKTFAEFERLEIDKINQALLERKEHMVIQVQKFQDRYSKLSMLVKKVDIDRNQPAYTLYLDQPQVAKGLVDAEPSKNQVSLNQLQQELRQIKRLLLKKEEDLNRSAASYSRLKQAFEIIKKHRRDLDTQARAQTAIRKDHKIETAGMSLQLFEKEEAIAEKNEKIASLNKQSTELLQRLTLVQAIIQEKNKEISALNNQLRKVAMRYQNQKTIQDNHLKEFQQQISQFKSELDQQGGMNRAKVQAFEEGILAYQRNLSLKNNEIFKLKESILSKDRKLTEIDMVLHSKDEKILEINGILEIYKNKLAVTTRTLQEKLKEIAVVQEQLQKMRDALSQVPKNEKLKRPALNRISSALEEPLYNRE